MAKTFNISDYKRQLNEFPQITYEEYQQIPDEQVRQSIAAKNKIIQTDTYNRTMCEIKGSTRSGIIETFTFSMRRAPNGSNYIVVDGIRKMIKNLFSYPISQNELDFAKAFYEDQGKKGGVGYFDVDMWQNVVNNGGFLPLTINAVPDGTVIHPKEPVITITGPSELAAVFEPMIIRPFFKSAIATTASMYADELGGSISAICEQGKRAGINEEAHMDGNASLIVGGGLDKTSNDAAALVYNLKTSGTTAHRFYSSYSTEQEAMNAAANIDNMILLSDLIDTKSGIEKILKIKQEKQAEGKNVMLRLDSGNIIELCLYALRRQKELGMMDVKKDKICISDGVSTIDKLKNLRNAIKDAGFDPDFLIYGIGGGLIANDKTRDVMSGAYKLTNTAELGPTGKLSNDIGKESIPGKLNIEIRDGVRYLVQESEPVQGKRLLETVYDNGNLYYGDDDLLAIEEARQQREQTLQRKEYPTQESDLTKKMHEQVRERLKSQII